MQTITPKISESDTFLRCIYFKLHQCVSSFLPNPLSVLFSSLFLVWIKEKVIELLEEWVPYKKNFYYFSDEEADWEHSIEECIEKESELISIVYSEEEVSRALG